MPLDCVGTPGSPLSLGSGISSAGKPHGTAAPSPSPDPTAGSFFAAGDPSNGARRGVEVGGNNLPLSGLLLVILPSLLVGKFPVWLCCFLLQFVILLPSFSLPAKADASLSPSPSDCELVGLVARNLISFWNTSESLVLVGALAIPRPGRP